jgi:hypothetical protein
MIYPALLKYGYANFSVEILEYCERSEAITREQYYLDLLNHNTTYSKMLAPDLATNIQKKPKKK